MRAKLKFVLMKFSKIQLSSLLATFCLFSMLSCNNADKDSWKDELKSTPEYARISELRAAMVYDDPLIQVNSKIDKFILEKSEIEQEQFYKTWDEELSKLSKVDLTELSSPKVKSHEDAIIVASEFFTNRINEAKLPLELKHALIRGSEQRTSKLIEIYRLEKKLKSRFPQLEKEAISILELQRSRPRN